MKKINWKRFLAAGLALLLLVTTAACGKSGKGAEGTTDFEREEEPTEAGLPPAVAAEVELPEDVRTMAYPIWALLVSASIDRLPYYGYEQNATDENAEAFYAPMSVLTTLIEEETDKGEGKKTDDGYYMLSEDAFSSYANALFDTYGMQAIEAPELPEASLYARETDDDAYPYAFAQTDLSDYHSVVTSCTKVQDNYGYQVVAELRDINQKTVLYEATFTMIPTSYEGEKENDIFNYSISGISDETDYVLKMEEDLGEEGGSSIKEETTELPENTGFETDTEASSAGKEKNTVEEPNPDQIPSDASGQIDKNEAGKKARDYSGSDDVTYQGTENLDGQDYYNYTYSDKDGKEKNVLVPSDGTDPVGGTKNDDGTWTFDQ